MRALLLSLALLASSCAGTCSAIGGGAIGSGAIGGGAIGCGAIGGCQQVVAAASTCDPFGSPDLAFMGCNVDGSNNTTLAHNDPVCTWVDSGSLGVDATQGTGSACPTFSAGGGPNGTRDAVVFDGGDWLAGSSVSAMTQPNMTAAVARVTGGAGSNRIAADFSFARNMVRVSTANRIDVYAGTVLDTGNVPGSDWHTIVATYNGASSSGRMSGTVGTTGDAGNAQAEGMIGIGGVPVGGSSGWVGPIADLLINDTPPTATDVEAYLAAHHDVTFPVTP